MLLGHSPIEKVEQRLTLKRNLANLPYKPPANQEALEIKVDRILCYANEVSEPDDYHDFHFRASQRPQSEQVDLNDRRAVAFFS